MGQQKPGSEQVDLEAIELVRQAHIATLNDGHVNAWVDAFIADGVQMPPHFPANVGRESIGAWSQGFLAPFRTVSALAVDEVQVAGRLGVRTRHGQHHPDFQGRR